MIFLFLLLVLGFIVLIKGADFLIDGAVSLSRKFGVPEIVIGLTVIAFGTSMPELVVNSFASIENQGAVVYGNIIGSNIANILLILGITGLICPVPIKQNTVNKEIPFSLFAVILLIFLSYDGILTRANAIILLVFFIGFLVYVFFIGKTAKIEVETVEKMSNIKMIIFISLGFVGLMVGGKLVVDSAVKIATTLGVSKKLIALTIVSIGTSLPELVASVVAARKGQPDIAIGNVIGSNIFNIFLIMGTSGLVNPVVYESKFNFDIGILIFATLMLIVTTYVGKKNLIERWQSGLFFITYIAYLLYSIYFM
ncbi:MAG: calcium/sodium antiporter [Fusobacteriaceae bacterium]